MTQTLLRIYVQPASSKAEVVGMHGDRLKIKVTSPPEDNRANQEVLELIRNLLGIRKSEIELIRGEKSRQKDLLIHLSPESVSTLLSVPIEFVKQSP